jgi:hypothetical protein
MLYKTNIISLNFIINFFCVNMSKKKGKNIYYLNIVKKDLNSEKKEKKGELKKEVPFPSNQMVDWPTSLV